MKSLNTRAMNMLQKLTLGLTVAACITGFASVALQAQDAQKTQDSKTIPLSQDDRKAIESHLGKGVVGKAVAAPVIDDAIYRFFAPGVGPVAFVEFKHISAMLVYSDNEKWGAVLTDHK